ncbi:MAG: trypsin-like peptidase domain-containing protein [Phycisphaerales bacterium]|nr:trypsin-like peptidase domain-containing protein [Phycisphaerales bacterium]
MVPNRVQRVIRSVCVVLASLAAAGGVVCSGALADVVTLKDGQVLDAPILKETSEALWMDLGHEVVKVPRAQIEHIQRSVGEDEPTGLWEEVLFRTAEELPERSPREHAVTFGEAVVVVLTPSGTGSGFIINPEGHTITNAHVIQGEQRIKCVVFVRDGQDFRRITIDDVEILAVNNHIDLAMLKLTHPDDGEFKTVYIQREEKLAAGQGVFAIGAPLGLERTLSEGVIATTQRSFDGLTYIQTTAQINPGNSGGPLFNSRGEVIGVTNMKIPFGEGLGFAIPARYVKDFLRNREAFAYDSDNPNSGHKYNDPPPRMDFGTSEILDDVAEDE